MFIGILSIWYIGMIIGFSMRCTHYCADFFVICVLGDRRVGVTHLMEYGCSMDGMVADRAHKFQVGSSS